MDNQECETESGQFGNFTNAIKKLKSELDRFVDTSWNTGEKTFENFWQRQVLGQIPIDLFETPDKVVVVANVPGLEAEQIEITLVGNVLSLHATTPSTTVPDDEKVRIRERYQGVLERSIPMPCSVNPEEVVAEMSHGVLKVTLTKAVSEKATKIKVTTPQRTPEPAAM